MEDNMNDLFLIYTTEEGGTFHACKTDDPRIFGAVRETRQIGSHGYEGMEYVEPAFVALVRVIENYDFILGRPR